MRLLVWLIALLLAPVASAHEVRPALLEIVEQAPGQWQVTWKQPVQGERALRLEPVLSNRWLDGKPASEELAPGHYIRRWRIAAPASALQGARFSVAGLDRSITSVVVRQVRADGTSREAILAPGTPWLAIEPGEKHALAVPAYLALGLRHILGGIDHLLFVLGLVLLIGANRKLVIAITAFTLAHSVTLAASALGLVEVPVMAVEALIAWSIVYVAFELTRREAGAAGLTARAPWLIALAFGLLHGFGFAGALAETGLPQGAIPMALLLFNLGVEIGQLLFVGAVLLAMRWISAPAKIPVRRLAAYAMGCYAAFLLFERSAQAFA